MTVTALGPCIVLKSKKMYLIAMKLSELNRLSHDLAEAKNLDPLNIGSVERDDRVSMDDGL